MRSRLGSNGRSADRSTTSSDTDLLQEFINQVATLQDSSRLFHGVSLQTLRQVFVNLVREGVPVADHREELMGQLQYLVDEIKDAELLTEKLREHVKDALCRSFTDDWGQLAALMLEEGFEQKLADEVTRCLDPAPAHRGGDGAGIRRHGTARAPSARRRPSRARLRSTLRLPLARMLGRFDSRIDVLSFTELPSDLIVTFAGLVSAPQRKAPPPHA